MYSMLKDHMPSFMVDLKRVKLNHQLTGNLRQGLSYQVTSLRSSNQDISGWNNRFFPPSLFIL